jgi:hypothetical protein
MARTSNRGRISMKAAIFKGKGKIVIEEHPKPTIKESKDAF